MANATTTAPAQSAPLAGPVFLALLALGGLTVLSYLGRSQSEPAQRRTRYKAGSKMAEIHERHIERVERERQEKAERRAEREAARRQRREQETEAKQQKREDDLAARLERGEVSGDALRQLMGSGQLRVRRNPPPELSTQDRAELTKAIEMAEAFHGEHGDRQIIELSPSERHLPRFLVALGKVPELEYEPDRGSSRSGYIWQHKAGDRGLLAPRAYQKPVLAADPQSRRPVLVPMRSPMRWEPRAGLVG